jgi:hypothetical protein
LVNKLKFSNPLKGAILGGCFVMKTLIDGAVKENIFGETGIILNNNK